MLLDTRLAGAQLREPSADEYAPTIGKLCAGSFLAAATQKLIKDSWNMAIGLLVVLSARGQYNQTPFPQQDPMSASSLWMTHEEGIRRDAERELL